ncbi:MAG: hypothetical protein OHK0019_33440 [Saprospiraceae bacterium]
MKQILNFSGTVSATNNGFSLVPTFTLGKPALVAIFNVSGKSRLSFEPEFRYSLEDFKPWSLIFIWRYKLVRKEKFQFSLGTHLPALNFITTTFRRDSVEEEVIKARRFFPVIEAIPLYRAGKNTTLSVYCQYGKGLEKEVANDIYFISLRAGFSKIPLTKQFFFRFNPQLYYLRIARNGGFYTAGSLALAWDKWPVSLSVMWNKALKTDIASKDFDWSLNLNYSFGKNFVEK